MENNQKIIYILLISFMSRNLTGIESDCKISPLLLLFPIFEHMCLTNLSGESNKPLNSLQPMVSKFLMFHENTELLPSSDCYDLSPGNIDPTEHIMLVFVGITIRNQPDLVEVAKED